MGWAGGSKLAEEIWEIVRPSIPEAEREKVAAGIVRLFWACDCDTMDEAETLAWDSCIPELQSEDFRYDEY